MYNKEREARLQATLWGHGGEGFEDADYFNGGNSLISTGDSDTVSSARTRLSKRIQKIVGVCYPWLHAGNEGMCIFNFCLFALIGLMNTVLFTVNFFL